MKNIVEHYIYFHAPAPSVQNFERLLSENGLKRETNRSHFELFTSCSSGPATGSEPKAIPRG